MHPECFPPPVELQEVTTTPFGLAVAGGKATARSYLVLHAGCSSELLGKGRKRGDLSHVFVAAITNVLEQFPAVSFMVHFFKGTIEREVVTSRGKQFMTIKQFADTFPNVEEDIRYVVRSGRL